MKEKRSLFILIITLGTAIIGHALFGILSFYIKTGMFIALREIFFLLLFHIVIRVIIGESVSAFFNRLEFNPNSFWLYQHRFEPKLYKALRVKKWKAILISAKPELFDVSICSPKELLRNNIQAEAVHEISMLISFTPLIFMPAAQFTPTVILSVSAAFADLVFVIVQRYNRPRILRILRHSAK